MTEAENQQDWLTPGERAMFMSALNKRIAELEQQNRALTHLIESMECDANG